MRTVYVWRREHRTISVLAQRLRAVWRQISIRLLLRGSDLRSPMAYEKQTFVSKVVGPMLLQMLFLKGRIMCFPMFRAGSPDLVYASQFLFQLFNLFAWPMIRCEAGTHWKHY